MSTEVFADPNILIIKASQEDATPKATVPNVTPEIFGVNTVDLQAFGDIALKSTLLPGISGGLRLLQPALELLPLARQLQATGRASVEDIAPYRDVLRDFVPKLPAIENIATKFGGFAVRALDRKITREVVTRTNIAAVEAKKKVEKIEEDIEHIAGFENPKEQFTAEMSKLSHVVTSAIEQQRDLRVAGHVEEVYNGPKGLLGFVTKVIHKVRGFFRNLFGGRKKQHEITAYDAGAGMNNVFNNLKQDMAGTIEKFPLLSRFMQKDSFSHKTFTKEHFSFVAPEVLSFLFSATNKTEKEADIIESVKKHPHDLRFVTNYKKTFKGYSLAGIQNASDTLIPAFINLLPTTGGKVTDIFNEIQNFVMGTPEVHLTEQAKVSAKSAPAKIHQAKNWVKKLKDKLKKKINKADLN